MAQATAEVLHYLEKLILKEFFKNIEINQISFRTVYHLLPSAH